MNDWTDEQLDRIGRTRELDVAPRRADGSLRGFTTIWVVRVDDDLYVRSWNGPTGSWYRAATASGAGRIRIDAVDHDVRFRPADDIDPARVDAAYREKYGRSSYVDAMVADGPAATTLQLTAG